MILILKILVYAWLFVSSFYVLFSAYATWHRMQKEGTLTWFDWIWLGPWALFGYIEDLIFSDTYGWIQYWESPWASQDLPWWNLRWLYKSSFTGRCKKWKEDPGRRGRIARWWKVKLNHIEGNHV